MAKFLVTNGSYFEPFTYDELAKPIMQTVEAHNAAQDAYDTLTSESEALRQYLLREPDDSQARLLYDSYMSKLDRLQNNLWKSGYNASTRRDLASARAGYASDITRLGTAIKARQDRSTEYWKTKHDHPDMIMGSDPGLEQLDKYLENDRFGQDYFSYSGTQFTNEVAADAKARAKEMLNDPKYINNPDLIGYITKITQTGFTSQQVQNAGDAVDAALASGDRSGISKLPIAEQILANVLLSHLDATGAQGRVSGNEFRRLVEYGKNGLSHAVGEKKYDELSDKEWDLEKQKELAGIKAGKGNGSGDGAGNPQGPGYSWNSLIEGLRSPGYDEFANKTKKQFRKYEDGKSYSVVKPDLTSENIDSPFAMAELVFNPEIRKTVRAKMGGLDVALPAQDFWGTTKSKQKVQIPVAGKDDEYLTLVTGKLSDKDADRLGLEHGGVGLYYGKDKLHDAATTKFNKARKEYQEYVQSFKDANPDLDFEALSITPAKERKIREDYKIDPRVDSSDVEAIVKAQEIQGDYSYATLGGSDNAFDYAKKNFAKQVINSHKHGKSNAGGKLEPGSRYAFYKVGEGGMTVSQRGETELSKVLGDKYGENSFMEIYISPFNAAEGAGNGRPKFRFTTNTDDSSVWQADASMLGDLVWNALKQPRYRNGWSACDAIDYMLSPILHPGDVLAANDSNSNMWGELVMQMLNDTSVPLYSASQISGPVISNAEGGFRFASAKDVVRSEALQDALYQAVTDYLNDIISVPRDMNNGDHQQHVNDSGSKPQSYLMPPTE